MRTVYGVQTGGGAMILKSYRGDGMRRRLEALADALDALVRSGVEAAPYMRTRDGLPYVKEEDGLWTMQPWLPGRHLSLRRRKERLEAARALAKLHKVPTGRMRERMFFLRVPPLWEKYRYRLERAQEASLKALDLGRLWRPYAEQARESLQRLQGTPCQRAQERDRKRGTLCHRDPAPHNLIWAGKSAGIIDFDLAGYDARAHDLYQLLNHALYLNGWEEGLFREMILAYEEVLPLCGDNRQVLADLMLYPSLVIREWYDYGKTGDRKSLLTRLNWAARQEERRLAEWRAGQ